MRRRLRTIGLGGAVWLGLGVPGVSGAPGDACLTERGLRPAASSDTSAVLLLSPEERRPLASGRKLVLVRGDVPEPGPTALAHAVDTGYQLIVGELGFVGFPDWISVTLVDLPEGAEGYVVLRGRGARAEIVLSRLLSGAELERALAHQVGHLAGLGYTREEPAWWNELSASWIGGKILAELEAERHAPQGRRAAAAPPGRLSFLDYLGQRFGDEVVRRVWETAAAAPGENLLASLRAVLSERGATLRGELESYAAWVLAEGRRRLAAGSQDSQPLLVHASRYPLEGRVEERGPQPLGVVFLGLQVSEVAGGLRIELQGQGEGPFAALCLMVPSGSFLPAARVGFGPDASGRAEIGVPVSVVGEVVVAVINLGAAGPLPFSFLLTPDDTFPFELSSFEAEPGPREVRLSWETLSEASVYGWSVLRGSADQDVLRRVNGVLVPGASTAGAPAGATYSLVDRDVRAGETYYYVLEAVTAEGLQAASHYLSVTLPR